MKKGGYKSLETSAPGSTLDSNGDGMNKINAKTMPTKSSASFAMQSIYTHNREKKTYLQRFDISIEDLSQLGKNHGSSNDIRCAMIALFKAYVNSSQGASGSDDVEDPDEMKSARSILEDIILCLQQDEETCESAAANAGADADTDKGALTQAQKDEMEDRMQLAATALTTIVLRSSPELGITNSEEELHYRMEAFGANHITEKKMTSFLMLCWEAVQDFVLVMLIVMGIVTLSVETTIGLGEGEKCGKCWLESFAILTSVCIVVIVTATIDYVKQFAFKRLSKSLDESNTKSVIRGGEVVVVTDANIVVGDILSVNSHSLASIPADCVLLGPVMELKMDESSLTGESHALRKKAGDIILSGTNAIQGSGKMVVIAVGVNSIAGKIKAHVYESEEGEALEGDTETPLYNKLDKIAKQIAIAGTTAAIFAFVVSASIGLGYKKEEWKTIIDYFVVAITVLAVAVPEGLPLAVVLALAFSSNKMMGENNMVKSLDACETMGCVSTVCISWLWTTCWGSCFLVRVQDLHIRYCTSFLTCLCIHIFCTGDNDLYGQNWYINCKQNDCTSNLYFWEKLHCDGSKNNSWRFFTNTC